MTAMTPIKYLLIFCEQVVPVDHADIPGLPIAIGCDGTTTIQLAKALGIFHGVPVKSLDFKSGRIKDLYPKP